MPQEIDKLTAYHLFFEYSFADVWLEAGDNLQLQPIVAIRPKTARVDKTGNGESILEQNT